MGHGEVKPSRSTHAGVRAASSSKAATATAAAAGALGRRGSIATARAGERLRLRCGVRGGAPRCVSTCANGPGVPYSPRARLDRQCVRAQPGTADVADAAPQTRDRQPPPHERQPPRQPAHQPPRQRAKRTLHSVPGNSVALTTRRCCMSHPRRSGGRPTPAPAPADLLWLRGPGERGTAMHGAAKRARPARVARPAPRAGGGDGARNMRSSESAVTPQSRGRRRR